MIVISLYDSVAESVGSARCQDRVPLRHLASRSVPGAAGPALSETAGPQCEPDAAPESELSITAVMIVQQEGEAVNTRGRSRLNVEVGNLHIIVSTGLDHLNGTKQNEHKR